MFDAFVQDRPALHEWGARLRGEHWIVLDTEFVRERTYYAQLCLVQIATPAYVICIDPLAIGDLTALLDVLYQPPVLKVLHAARQDLEVFCDLGAKPPAPVFDTQVAAALTGFQDQLSYAGLVEALLGVKLGKHSTRTDWAQRPLSAAQLRYAEEDVRYLCALYPLLRTRLEKHDRCRWLEEECTRLTHPELYRHDADTAYARIRQGHTLAPAGQQVLRALARWRELTAQAQNLPRNWVLPDSVLLELARTSPRTEQLLAQTDGLSRAALKKWSKALLAAISNGLAAEPRPLFAARERFNGEQVARCERMLKFVQARARELAIAPALIATRKDIQALIRGERSGSLLTGWRRDLVGESLVAML